MRLWFPSPDGDIGFKLESLNLINQAMKTGTFPSPDGDIGFKLLMGSNSFVFVEWEFPSPDGDIGFKLS